MADLFHDFLGSEVEKAQFALGDGAGFCVHDAKRADGLAVGRAQGDADVKAKSVGFKEGIAGEAAVASHSPIARESAALRVSARRYGRS